MTDQRAEAAPLAGLKVVDFSHFIAGPICTMLLADMGAEVIKIENSSAGDDLRRFPPLLEGQSSAFLWTNRNKVGIALDLKQPQGIDVARELIASADILGRTVSEVFGPAAFAAVGGQMAAAMSGKRVSFADELPLSKADRAALLEGTVGTVSVLSAPTPSPSATQASAGRPDHLPVSSKSPIKSQRSVAERGKT